MLYKDIQCWPLIENGHITGTKVYYHSIYGLKTFIIRNKDNNSNNIHKIIKKFLKKENLKM